MQGCRLVTVQRTDYHPYMARTPLSERVELRASAEEVASWRRAADQQGTSLSDYVRSAASTLAAPSSFRNVLHHIRRKIVAWERQGGTAATGVLHLTVEEEFALMGAGRGDLGGERMGVLVVEGVQKAFPRLLGYEVNWRSHQFLIAQK